MEMNCNYFDSHEPAPNAKTVCKQYASDVRSFSSQYGSEISISYTAYNICGKPSKYPAYGDFPQTFVMVSINDTGAIGFEFYFHRTNSLFRERMGNGGMKHLPVEFL